MKKKNKKNKKSSQQIWTPTAASRKQARYRGASVAGWKIFRVTDSSVSVKVVAILKH